MLEEEALKKARSGLLRWLSYRSRTLWEAECYLERKGFTRTVVEAVLAEMLKLKYIDDARFTAEYIESCLRRGLGPNRVRADLKNKKIDPVLIADGLAQFFNAEEDLLRAIDLLKKRITHDNILIDQKWLRRQVAFLRGRGYNEAVIMKAVKPFYQEPFDDETLS